MAQKPRIDLAGKAVELIDLTKHQGEHPRMGAVDVIPFIPIEEDDQGRGSGDLQTSGAKDQRPDSSCLCSCMRIPLPLPTGSTWPRSARASLKAWRKRSQQPKWEPDFGGRRIHPTAGVVAVGARMPLVAFNINLSTSDVEIATKIAKIIRRINGGFDCVKAMGVMLEERNLAQVSINMTDFNRTPLYRVLELVKAEAARWGVHVVGTEIVGLTPMKALIDSAEYYMQIEAFDFDKQVLENHIL